MLHDLQVKVRKWYVASIVLLEHLLSRGFNWGALFQKTKAMLKEVESTWKHH